MKKEAGGFWGFVVYKLGMWRVIRTYCKTLLVVALPVFLIMLVVVAIVYRGDVSVLWGRWAVVKMTAVVAIVGFFVWLMEAYNMMDDFDAGMKELDKEGLTAGKK